MMWPDIIYAVFYLERFNYNSHPTYWAVVKHLLHYLKGTSSYKLVYKTSNNSELFQTYSDVSHSGCKESSCSIDGYTTIVCSGAVR